MCLSPTNRTLVLQTCGRQRAPYSLHHRERCRASEQAEHSQQRVLDKVFSVPDVAGEAPTVGVRRRTVFLQLVDVPAPGPADSALNAKCICGSIHHCAAPVRSTRRTGKPRRYLARYLGPSPKTRSPNNKPLVVALPARKLSRPRIRVHSCWDSARMSPGNVTWAPRASQVQDLLRKTFKNCEMGCAFRLRNRSAAMPERKCLKRLVISRSATWSRTWLGDKS
jgi:hypothetical protein